MFLKLGKGKRGLTLNGYNRRYGRDYVRGTVENS